MNIVARYVWDPHTNRCQPKEAVQRRAARFCFRRFTRKSSTPLVQADLGLSLLSARHEQARLILMFNLYVIVTPS